MALDFEELSRRAEEKAANFVKKSAAVASGTFRGMSSSMPRWLKIVMIIVAIWIVLAILGSLGEKPRHY